MDTCCFSNSFADTTNDCYKITTCLLTYLLQYVSPKWKEEFYNIIIIYYAGAICKSSPFSTQQTAFIIYTHVPVEHTVYIHKVPLHVPISNFHKFFNSNLCQKLVKMSVYVPFQVSHTCTTYVEHGGYYSRKWTRNMLLQVYNVHVQVHVHIPA